MVMRKIMGSGLLILIAAGCTIRPPDVIITTEKTALENQLLGTSQKITDDPLSVAALWSMPPVYGREYETDTSGQGASEGRRRLILAQIRRQTLQEYIYQLKRDGILGEGSDGLLKVMADTLAEPEAVERIADAENEDRMVIMGFYAKSQGRVSEQDMETVRSDFAELMARESPTGTWVDDPETGWKRK
jgi:hypothetical protein